MKALRVALLGLVLAAVAAIAPVGPGAASPRDGTGFVRVEGTGFVLDGKPFVMKGFNYFPRDYGWTSMTGWDWAAVDRELALAQSVGSNTLRTGINFLYATGNTWEATPLDEAFAVTPAYFAAIDRLLSLADARGMKVILWVADGMPAELWRPDRFDVFRRHLESLVPRYANDPRIAAWDLYTDLDPSMLLPAGEGGWGVPWASRDAMVELLRREAAVFRQLDPNHPLGVGFSWASSSLLVQDFTDFLMPQFLGGDHPEIVSSSTLGPETDYGKFGTLLEIPGRTLYSLQEEVQLLRRGLHRPMPIVLSEFGSPSRGGLFSRALQAAVYDAVCEIAFEREHLAGAFAWALTDFRWPPLGETNIPADAPQSTEKERSFGAFDLGYQPKPSAEVARRWFTAAPTVSTPAAPAPLVGAVGPGGTITLKQSGALVKTLEAGTYRIAVHDRAPGHSFHLQGPGVNRVITGVGFVGTRTVVVQLQKGSYRYFCDVHRTTMKRTFTVF